MARWLNDHYPESTINVDEIGVGASVIDHLQTVLEVDAVGINFAVNVDELTQPGEPIYQNMRALCYFRLARLIDAGLALLPDDPELREEAMAHEVVYGTRIVREGSRSVRREMVKIAPKDQVKKLIGRSPDKLDALVMAAVDVAGDGGGISLI